MFLDLKAAITEIEPLTLTYPYFYLSLPDTISNSTYLSFGSYGRFEVAAHQAGLEPLQWRASASKAALNYHDHHVDDCIESEEGIDTENGCGVERNDIAVVIAYGGSSLEATVARWDDGFVETESIALDLELGTESIIKREDEAAYWAMVARFLEDVVEDVEGLRELMVIGEYSSDEGLRGVVKDVLEGKGYEKSLVDGGWEMGDGLLYASRGAARLARGWMWSGPDACLPNPWCEIVDFHDEL